MEYFQEAYAKLDSVSENYFKLATDFKSGRTRSRHESLGIIAKVMIEYPVKDEAGTTDLSIEELTRRVIDGGIVEGTSEGSMLPKIRKVGYDIGVEVEIRNKYLYIKEINQN